MSIQPLIPAPPDDLVASQLRLAAAKDDDDQAQRDLRDARADATAAKKELRAALVGWRAVLRQMDAMPADHFQMDMDTDDDLEEDDDPVARDGILRAR